MTVYSVEEIRGDWPDAHIGDEWVPARPINYTVRTLWERVREAWDVFRGKTDSIRWPKWQ